MSIANRIRNAAIEANGVLAQVGGARAGMTNVIGPNGVGYIGVFRSASAFEVSAVGSEMEANGYKDGEVIILTITRAQFTFVPLGWRRQQITRPFYHQTYRVASITVTDPLLYSFVLLYKQGPAT